MPTLSRGMSTSDPARNRRKDQIYLRLYRVFVCTVSIAGRTLLYQIRVKVTDNKL